VLWTETSIEARWDTQVVGTENQQMHQGIHRWCFLKMLLC